MYIKQMDKVALDNLVNQIRIKRSNPKFWKIVGIIYAIAFENKELLF